MSWFTPTPTIDLILPGIGVYCQRFKVTVDIQYNSSTLIFGFEGVWHRTEYSKFEVLADSDQFCLLNLVLYFICDSLKKSYMGMDN